MNTVYIAIGSNIDPETNVRRCIDLLREYTHLVAVSSIYQTPPMGYADQDDFLNLAVLIETEQAPEQVRVLLLDQIEQELGRERDPKLKSGPRTIDLDIALWNNEVLDYGARHIPHPDVTEFAHTILPIAELAPDYIHPEAKRTLADIAEGVSQEGIFRREDINI